MARKVKGCMNTSCIANKKRLKYKQDDNYCLKCGISLVEVCKKCYTPLPPDYTEAICDRCIAEKDDKKDKRAKVGAAGIAGGAGIIVVGKKVFDIAKSLIS